MKKGLFLLGLLLLSLLMCGQTITDKTLSSNYKIFYMHPKAGSCGSPDGGMNPTASPPPSYAWLQANGYCNPRAYGTNPTVCWTFTPTSSSVTINSGYSVSGCVNVSFGAFNLYNSSCVLIGTGLSFTGLTPGIQYTWCMTGSAWGGGGCTGFNDFCPYYYNNVVLPVELEEFIGYNSNSINHLAWVTASEINNNYFILERSRDLFFWKHLDYIPGNGTVNTPSFYEYPDDSYSNGINYYRLIQVDLDGKSDTLATLSIATDKLDPNPIVRKVNVLGQEVSDNYSGIVFYIYKNGYVKAVKKSKKN